jgi:hypothetical protein
MVPGQLSGLIGLRAVSHTKFLYHLHPGRWRVPVRLSLGLGNLETSYIGNCL